MRYLINKYCTKQNIAGTVIFAVFIALALFSGKRHEPWADEAQAWLIARDLPVFDMLVKYIRYERSPALWHLILKFFISCGLPYENFYLIPVLFSAAGVFLIEFKSKFPVIIKALLPFSYFIFYQFTIVARSYCLILPALCFAAVCYDKKAERPAGYCLALALLAGISTHTLLLSGFLFLLYLIDTLKRPGLLQDRVLLRSHLLSSAIVCFCLLIHLLSAFPPNDVSFTVEKQPGVLPAMVRMFFIISKTMIANEYSPITFVLGTIIFASLIFFRYSKKAIPVFALGIAPVLLFLSVFYCNEWHVGILFLTMLFVFWVLCGEKVDDKHGIKHKLFYGLLTLVLLVQLFWTGRSVVYDHSHNYSAARDTAEFLKENEYDEKTVMGLGYSATAVLPYFDENIFENYKTEKAFYWWSEHNNYMTKAEIMENLPEIAVISDFYKENYADVISALEQKGYSARFFEGNTFVKTAIYESEGFIVYIADSLPQQP